MTHSDLQSRRQAILDVPLNRHLGLVLEEATETSGSAEADTPSSWALAGAASPWAS